jgi:ATP-dependent protease ClpP protease subunit
MTMKLTNDPGWQLKADGPRARLDIYDVIGKDWFGDGVSAKDVRDALVELDEGQAIDVHINSPGGHAFDGITIYNQLDQHKGEVVTHVDGLAASAASLVFMAGDERYMADNAMLMIHNASGIAFGDSRTMATMAGELDKLDSVLARTYAKATQNDEAAIRDQMNDETWFTAEEAVADGFATKRKEEMRAAAAYGPDALDRIMSKKAARVARQFCNKASNDAEPNEDSNMDITPEAFAEKFPDAVNAWKAEAVAGADIEAKIAEAQVAATDEATKDERERCVALAKAFPDHPTFLAEQIEAGHGVAKAKAAAYDARLADTGGAEYVNTGVTPDEPNDESKKEAKLIKETKALKTEYARKAHLSAYGRLDLLDKLDG